MERSGPADTQSVSPSLSILSSFSAPIAAFTPGPTIDPRIFANGNRNDSGVSNVAAFDSLQVGSVKVWRRSSVGPVEYLRGPATTKVATQVTKKRQSFISWSRVVEVSDIGCCFAGDQDAVDTE
jgi:hypothetical protein